MNTYSKSELFSLANKIRKEQKVSQKDAYALAKAQLENVNNENLHDKLYIMMKQRNVKFTFKKNKNKEITTTGTLVESHIPSGKRTIQGRKEPKDNMTQVFYDVRHGVYRSYNKNKLVRIVK